MQAEWLQSVRSGRKRVRCYRSQCKLKRYQACELEGSERGITEDNASWGGTKLTNWKAVSAALEKSVQAEEVPNLRNRRQRVRHYRNQCKLIGYKACEVEGSECGLTEVNAS